MYDIKGEGGDNYRRKGRAATMANDSRAEESRADVVVMKQRVCS